MRLSLICPHRIIDAKGRFFNIYSVRYGCSARRAYGGLFAKAASMARHPVLVGKMTLLRFAGK